MKALVDSSVWVAYFKGTHDLPDLDWLIEEALAVTNELVLAELLPALLARGEKKLAGLLREVECLPLAIDWDGVIQMQLACLRNGVNKVGIPDLIIAQHAMRNRLALFTLDKHLRLLAKHAPLTLYG